MPEAIVFDMRDGTTHFHQLDGMPVVERWAIAFIDTDGAAWCYIASSIVRYVVTKFVDVGDEAADVDMLSVGDVGDREAPGDTDHPDVNGPVDVAMSPTDPDRAAGATPVPVESADGSPTVAPAPAARQFEVFTGRGSAGGGPPRFDYDDVHAFVLETIAAGGAVSSGLMERFDVTQSMAGYLMKQLRKRGYEVPALRRGGGARGPVEAADIAPVAKGDIPCGIATPNVAFPEPPTAKTPWQLIPPKAAAPQPAFVDLDINPLDEPQPPETRGLTHATIAAAYLEAEDGCRFPISDLADRFEVPRTWVKAWVRECREQGLLPPRDVPQTDRVAPSAKVVKGRGVY